MIRPFLQALDCLFHFLDFLLLLRVGVELVEQSFLFLGDEHAVIAVKTHQFTILTFDDAGGDGIQKHTVVRDEKERGRTV